jgi:prolyl oligopeptidase
VIKSLFLANFALLLALSNSFGADDNTSMPPTPQKPVTDEYHGIRVTDPYRWLENGRDPAVRQWTEAQNRVTRSYLDPLPYLKPLQKRFMDLASATSGDYLGLQFRGGRFFALRYQPPKEQLYLITFHSPEEPAPEQVVVDPNQINAEGKTAIDFFVPSLDGRLVAVSLSENGSEDGTVHVYETDTGKKLPDIIPRVQYPTGGGSVAWNAESSGFYYTRYPHAGERPREDVNFYQQIYFHKLGTPADQDTYVLGKEFPRIAETTLATTDDGRHLLATVANGDGGEYAHYLLDPSGKWIQLTHFEDQVTAVAFGPDQALYLFCQKDAPRGKILRLSLETPALSAAKLIVPQGDVAIQGISSTSNAYTPSFVVTANRLYLIDCAGGPEQIRSFDHDGGHAMAVPVPRVSSVAQIVAQNGDEILFRSQSYTTPPAWYRFDPRTGKVARTALYRTSPVDFRDIDVTREFAVSRDGTKVPLNILRPKGTQLNGRNPTLLTGYGGFGINQSPGFSAGRRVWFDQGGILVIANLRGGKEYGEDWHTGGNLTHKQNVFDDFLACARHLIERKYTSSQKLAIEGGSNGGLLMGAALTQHPELFRAVVARVGLYDMLRFEIHPNGVFNVPEYGSVKDPEQFKALYAYSPYHHVKEGTAYPGVLLLVGENDGRVDPGQSRKMTARLQAATSSGLPILLRTNFGSGHGMGSSLSDQVAQQADVEAFLFRELGVEYRD